MQEPNSPQRGITLVTGSRGLIGRHVISTLQARGWPVVGIDLSNADRQADDQLLCDIANRVEFSAAVDEIQRRHGTVTRAIHCAAVNDAIENRDRKSRLRDRDFVETLRVNVFGTAVVLGHLAETMAGAGIRGSLVALTSLYTNIAPDPRLYEAAGERDKSLAYVASKAACEQIVRYFAVRYAKFGIRVNAIAPGGVFNDQSEAFVQHYSARVPMGRMATVEEVVNAAIGLAVEQVDYFTGQTLVVDGGYSAW